MPEGATEVVNEFETPRVGWASISVQSGRLKLVASTERRGALNQRPELR